MYLCIHVFMYECICLCMCIYSTHPKWDSCFISKPAGTSSPLFSFSSASLFPQGHLSPDLICPISSIISATSSPRRTVGYACKWRS